MIHFPRPWLDWLKDTSFRINHIPVEFMRMGGSTESGQLISAVVDLEFKIHVALFCVRKIEESVGIPLKLKEQKFNISFWPATPKTKHLISSTPQPPLGEWYILNTGQNKSLSAKEIIDLFIHARLCGLSWDKEEGMKKDLAGFFVCSDWTMKKNIFLVSLSVVDEILTHTIKIFEPIIEARDLRMTKKAA